MLLASQRAVFADSRIGHRSFPDGGFIDRTVSRPALRIVLRSAVFAADGVAGRIGARLRAGIDRSGGAVFACRHAATAFDWLAGVPRGVLAVWPRETGDFCVWISRGDVPMERNEGEFDGTRSEFWRNGSEFQWNAIEF